MKNIKKEKQVRAPRYFVGRRFQDLMVEISQLFLPALWEEVENPPQIKIIPVNPLPYKLWWEFYADDVKICTICYEAQDEENGTNNISWLEWYTNFQDTSIREFYDRAELIPEWVETDEDEDKFFKIE